MTNGSKILLAVVIVIIIIFGIFFISNIKNEEELNLPVINNTENVENNEEKENERKEEEITKYVQMYLMLFDHIMEEDNALNHEMEFLAIDMHSLDKEYLDPEIKGTTRVFDINEDDEQVILDYMKKYHHDIRNNTFEELKEQGEFDEKNLVLDGILIYVSNIEIVSEDNFLISMVKYRSGLGAIFPEYSVKYKDGNWEISVVSMAIS